MEQKVYKKSYPTTVLKLYIRLYCKKRNAPKNKMMEAIQSWVTLNENEREQFINKYKECEINYKKKMANYLSKAQPFLKKKYLKRNRAVSDLTVNKKLYNEQINTEKIVIDEEVPVPCTLEREVENLSSLDNMDEVGITHCDLNVTPQSPPRTDSFTNSNQTSNDILAEPVPPSTL
ncbi:unnamed protein product [Diatraea saccharalis]|nr:unnamed protein product [Diatraea saccharalis]